VALQAATAGLPVYGVVWFSARTQVDEQADLVRLDDIAITRVSFPPPTEGDAPDYLALMRQLVPTNARSINLSRLQSNLAIGEARAKTRRMPLKNDPPRILFSTTPAILVLVEGEPVARPVAGTNLARVINTRALILRGADGKWSMYLIDRWLSAPAIEGPWTALENASGEMERAKQAAVEAGRVDLLDQADSDARMAVDFGSYPTVLVSTVPTALVQTQGAAQLEPIEGTELQFVTNTYDDIFLHTPASDYYVLLSGRWFRSKSLAQGPWSFVPGKSLPADFARIPTGTVAADVRPSVPGTPEAATALIDNAMPRTATVGRRQAVLSVRYDGKLEFRPVEGTSLAYAANATTPVIRKNPYYAAYQGVWFESDSADGPWVVATEVPDEIYDIPPSSPVYPVTYLTVYGSTDEVVYVGYTPGYLGAVESPDGVVVYGTGWDYEPWVGSYWVGTPLTYGVGAALAWDAVDGFGWGFRSATVLPWWSPVGWDWDAARVTGVAKLAAHDAYAHWGGAVLGDRSMEAMDARLAGWRSGLYAAEDGRVYRRGERGWEYGGGGGWRAGWPSADLEREAMARLSFARPGWPAGMGGFRGGRR
jgi:hypothetical protein